MDQDLHSLTKELEREFRSWDHYRTNGGSDPFWPDGTNMNLIRNHILFCKHKIQELVDGANNEMTLFQTTYPDIWYRETPPEMPDHFMAKAEEIRARAKEQLSLYQADPNFQYLRENARKAFPHGETRETRSVGLPYYAVFGLDRYEKDIAQDDLVSMRRDFHEDYEPRAARWAKYAGQIRAYLAGELIAASDSLTTAAPDLEDEFDPDELDESAMEEAAVQETQPSLDSLLKDAQHRAAAQKEESPVMKREEQLSFF